MKSLAVDIGSEFGSPFGGAAESKGIGDLISFLLSASFAVAGILILVLLIFAGISIIAGTGSSNPEQVEKGKKAATSAVIGFAIIFSAYWVIRVIEIVVGVPFVTSPGI